mgnify:CR=1 FL=1
MPDQERKEVLLSVRDMSVCFGKGKKVFLMGGGIGVPPILQLAKELDADKSVLVGYRDSNLFLKEDLKLKDEKELKHFFPKFDFYYPIDKNKFILLNKNTLAGTGLILKCIYPIAYLLIFIFLDQEISLAILDFT